MLSKQPRPETATGQAGPSAAGNPVEFALFRAQWEPVLFAERPSRLELLKLKAPWALTPLLIRVHRNHSFEHVAAASAPGFAWWGCEAGFLYSDYDDSLSFAFADDKRVQLELLWLDLQRYQGRFGSVELGSWLEGRLTALRAHVSTPIVLATVGEDEELHMRLRQIARGLPGTRVADLRALMAGLGIKFFDERAAKFSGTRLSDAASVLVARELACRWAPAMLRPRLKAVALDLDHTLYAGVLGEDGDQVRLTPAHAALQQFLVGLRDQGVFLALVSRNEEADVRQLFQKRPDFPLRWEHFSATAVSWAGKAQGIQRVAQTLRIGLDAILFVDDNPGELASVVSELPGIATAHAQPDAAATQRLLEYYPRLWSWERTATDALRATDLAAETERSRLAAQTVDPREYLRCLQVRLLLELNPRQQLTRLHELSQKTNQFNLNLSRFSEVDIAQMLDAPDHRMVLIHLSDRLSDSGPIGLLVARRQGDTLAILELAISCRALGRGLEDLMVAEAVRAIQVELPAARIEFLHRTGPRNGPAREWLVKLTGQTLPSEGRVAAQEALPRISARDYPVTVNISSHESN
jgi:FkbH-like protein